MKKVYLDAVLSLVINWHEVVAIIRGTLCLILETSLSSVSEQRKCYKNYY